MASFCRLSERFERVVLVGGLCSEGAVVAAGVALSPFLHPHQLLVLANAIVPDEGAIPPLTTPDTPSSSWKRLQLSANDPSGYIAPQEFSLAQEAEETLAAIRRDAVRSRSDVCRDGSQPSMATPDVLPSQYFIGNQYPTTAGEVAALLARVRLHSCSSTASSTASAAGPLRVRKDKDVLMCVLSADASNYAERHDNVVRQILRVVTHSHGGTGTPQPRHAGGCVIAVTDDRSRHALPPLVQATGRPAAAGGGMPSCLLVVARARELAPPALEYALTKASVESCVRRNATDMLSTICGGVLLGLLSQLPVYRHDCTPLVPVDIAVNVALCQAIAQLQAVEASVTAQQSVGKASPPARVSSGASDGVEKEAEACWQSVIAVEPPRPTDTMVWGMLGEYLSDYYGRYAPVIRAAFPAPQLLPRNPAPLNFTFSARDSLNYGVDTLDVTRCLEHKAAVAQRKRLETSAPDSFALPSFLNRLDAAAARAAEHAKAGAVLASSSATRAMDESMVPAPLRDKVPGLVSPPPPSPSLSPLPRVSSGTGGTVSWQLHATMSSPRHGRCDGGAYPRLLDLLTARTPLVPLRQYTALSEVDWNMYVVFVAKVVLDGFARHAATPSATAAEQPLLLPFPTRMFANDLAFVEAHLAPPQQSATRRMMGITDWMYRIGLNANGVRGEMSPGFTQKRMATLLAEPHVQQVIEAIAASGAGAGRGKEGKGSNSSSGKDDVVKRAKRILVRMGDTQNHAQCRAIGILVYQLFDRVYKRVFVNAGAFDRLRRVNTLPRTCIVYIPLHRSYSDFLIMSYLLIVMGLRPPHIVAGEDFLRLGKFSELMRGSGAFFMRRTFRGDPLYGALFKEYVAQMVKSGLPLEFFIEGTRSRTGKTMLPKMGILKFVTDAFFSQEEQQTPPPPSPSATATVAAAATATGRGDRIEDILFIPVSLSYDKLLEAKVYADELLGIPKPKESLSNMIKAATQLTDKYGDINMHFGEPISLRRARENTFECPVPFQPREMEPPSATRTASATNAPGAAAFPQTNHTPARLLTSLAWRITYELQRNAVITAPALVAAAFETLMPLWEWECLQAGRKDRQRGASEKGSESTAAVPLTGLPRTRLVDMTAWIAQAVELRGGNLHPTLSTTHASRGGNVSVDWERVTTTALQSLNRFIRPERPASQRGAAGEASLHDASPRDAIKFDPPTITSQLGVNISTNQLIHVFIDEAVVAVAVHAGGDDVIADTALASSPSSTPAGRAMCMDALRQKTHFLRRLLSTEFPNFAAFSPCSDDSWLQYALSRLRLGAEEQQALQRCRRLRAASRKGHVTGSASSSSSTAVVVVPETRLYHFLLQLLLPHVEALYLVAVTALACFEAAAVVGEHAAGGRHQPVLVKYLTIAAHKAGQRLYEQRIAEYVVACNKESVAHYFESLVDQKFLRTHAVADVGLAYVPGEAAAGTTSEPTAPSKEEAGSAAAGPQSQRRLQQRRPQLGGLEKLVLDLQAMRWHPSTDPPEDIGIAKRTVLTCYHAVSRGAKL